MDGDRARRRKWTGLAAELDAEVKIVKVKKKLNQTVVCDLADGWWPFGDASIATACPHFYNLTPISSSGGRAQG